MSIKTNSTPNLKSIWWWIEALWEFFIPKWKRIIEESRNMVQAVLWLQGLSWKLFEEYSKLYNTNTITATTPLVWSADHAGFDSLVWTRPTLSGIAKNIRSLSEETIERNIEKIRGIQPNMTLPIMKKWIQIRFKLFQIYNQDRIEKELIWFADPDIQFEREKHLYARNFSSRLEESLDPSNPFIQKYPDLLEEIEKAIWHEIIFIATIISDKDLFGNSFVPLNYTKENPNYEYLPGEESLSQLIGNYRRKYFEQFLIHQAITLKGRKIFQ